MTIKSPPIVKNELQKRTLFGSRPGGLREALAIISEVAFKIFAISDEHIEIGVSHNGNIMMPLRMAEPPHLMQGWESVC